MGNPSDITRRVKLGPITNNADMATAYFRDNITKICDTPAGCYLITKDDILISGSGWDTRHNQRYPALEETDYPIYCDVLDVPPGMAEALHLTDDIGIQEFQIYVGFNYDTDTPAFAEMLKGNFSTYIATFDNDAPKP